MRFDFYIFFLKIIIVQVLSITNFINENLMTNLGAQDRNG